MTTINQPASPVSQAQDRPNYWVGFLLNIFLAGSGFTYINRGGWHFGWLVIVTTFSLLAVVLSFTSPAVAALLGLGVMVVMLLHYRRTFALQMTQKSQKAPMDNGLKWGLVVGQFLLALIVSGGLAVFALPPLQAAMDERNDAYQTLDGMYVSQKYFAVAAAAADGTATTGDCLTAYSISVPSDRVKACFADVTDLANVKVTVTFRDGQVIKRPW